MCTHARCNYIYICTCIYVCILCFCLNMCVYIYMCVYFLVTHICIQLKVDPAIAKHGLEDEFPLKFGDV